MLIPPIQRHESELSEVVAVDSHLVDGSDSDNVHSCSCTGPVTHSQTKLQRTLKANLFMNEWFETSVDPTIVGPCSFTLKTLIADYFQLKREFLDQVLHK